MYKTNIAVLGICFLILAPGGVFANEIDTSDAIVTGPGVGLDISAGLVGVFAAANVGVLLPKISERFQIGLRGSWSMPAVSVAHENADETEVVSYLPWLAYGAVFFHVGTPVIRNLLKVYFGCELLVGTTQALEDNYIGSNVTVGAIPYLGLELYTKQSFAIMVESGLSAVFTLTQDDSTVLGSISQHGGTGYFVRLGPRFYFGKK